MGRPVLILPDLHAPNHDEVALEIVKKAAAILRPREIVILGDWLDCEAFSSHPASSLFEEERPFATELDIVTDTLEEFRKLRSKIVYIEGNHEQRVEKWCAKVGGQLGHDLYARISPRERLGPYLAKWVPYAKADIVSRHEITPDLWAVHGWSHAKHSASIHQQKAVSVSIVHGHTHRAQSYARREPSTGRVLKAWSPGCLAKFQPMYRHRHGPDEWTHGFSIVYVSSKDPMDWTDYCVQIKPGGYCVLPDGKQVKL